MQKGTIYPPNLQKGRPTVVLFKIQNAKCKVQNCAPQGGEGYNLPAEFNYVGVTSSSSLFFLWASCLSLWERCHAVTERALPIHHPIKCLPSLCSISRQPSPDSSCRWGTYFGTVRRQSMQSALFCYTHGFFFSLISAPFTAYALRAYIRVSVLLSYIDNLSKYFYCPLIFIR